MSDTRFEMLDAQVIFHAREAVPDVDLGEHDREAAATDMAVLALDAVGVDGALWHGNRSSSEVAVSRHPDRFRAMVYYPEPGDVADVEAELTSLRDTPGLAGIRLTPAWPPTGENIERMLDGAYDAFFSHAERLGLPVSFFMFGHLPKVEAVAKSYPGLRLLIDHLGLASVPMVPLVPERLDELPDLLSLAARDNVAVKFTGVPALSYEDYPFRDLWPACRQVIDTFGPERVLWGSDFRRLRPLCSFADVVGFLRDTDQVTDDEKRLMFADSLRAWVDWPRSG